MTETYCHFKRVTCKRPRPNQYFHELLESLYLDAVKNSADIAPALSEAISSLEKYPLPLSSGAECAILKGFDQRLCRYIDQQINPQPAANKKSKINDNGHSSSATVKSLQALKNIPVLEMSNDKKNRKKIKNLKTNIEKCTLVSKFGESSYNSNVHLPAVDFTDNNNMACKKNNNKPLHYLVDDNLELESQSTYYEDSAKKDLCYTSMHNTKELKSISNLNLNFCENRESLTSYDSLCREHYNTDRLKTVIQPIEVLDSSENDSSCSENSVTEVNLTSDDESICQIDDQHGTCVHIDESTRCQPCETIMTAVNNLDSYCREKFKKKFSKCCKSCQMYSLTKGSKVYAIVISLLEQQNECPYRDCLTKDELIQKAQKHSQLFTIEDMNCTAWLEAKWLSRKLMINIKKIDKNPKKFYNLSSLGRIVAMELANNNNLSVADNDIIYHQQPNDRVPSLDDVMLAPPPPVASIDEEQSSVFIAMPPGTFDIVLLIDKRENFDKNIPANPANNCKFEARSLTVGDFLWVARSKKTGQELVLPYIVERKRMDDLASSIKDGRFHEQKYRLRKCGLENVIYMVESYKRNVQYGLPAATLMQAIVNTSILDEFNIVRTDSLKHTFLFLGVFSMKLVSKYVSQNLRGSNTDTGGSELMTYDYFSKLSRKNKPLTVRDTFIKMLLQLKGVSVEKALAVTNRYSTPRLLMKAYARCTEKEGELLLASLKYNSFSKSVGSGVSGKIYKLFSQFDI